ncbi:EmrB/QacA subfamily drug resistance transporter [Williamsia limnetica]|uniref:EmrB/QacA subfamily drug resistance transporter n=1 Tax=Williamsia limnetica TaxID=882452 RepID=A0A318RJ23_WILLI|nr:MFS transporter [Williamsia limnetica]PYE15026.1 EmrB/QacA subfamily drug resistance transporter [Williamsia limnetica]
MKSTVGASPDERIGLRTVWLIFVACVAVSMVIAAMASLNTAIPDIAPAVQANSNQVTWLIDGYTLTLAALLLPAGAIGDRFGRREVLIAGLIVFAIGSLLPIWVSDPTQFIAARCLTGVGAAFVMPATLSLITSGVPASKRPLAVSIWAGVAGAGGIAGFFVTGVLLEFFSWHSIFLTFAIAAAVTAVLSCTIPTSRDSTSPKFDVWGSVTSALAVALVVFAFIESPHRGWFDPLTVTAFVVGIGLAAVFWYSQSRRAEPLLDVKLFGNSAFAAGSFSVMIQFMVAFGLFLVLLQYLQLVFGYSPLKSAIALFPMVIVVMVCSLIGNWIAVKVNLRIILSAGMLVMGVGVILLGVIAHSEYWTVAVCLVVFALGLGIATAPSTTAIMVNTPADNQGVGSAINDTSRELGSAIGIAIAGSLLASGYTRDVNATADAAQAQLRQTASQLESAGQVGRAQEVAAAADGIKEHITNTLAEALQVAERLAPEQPELATRIAEGAKDAFIGPMNAASITLGALSIAAGVILAIFTPNRMDSDVEPEKLSDR